MYGILWTTESAERNKLTRQYEPIQPFVFYAFCNVFNCKYVFDIGANIGAYSLLSAMHENVKNVYAFEPDLDAFSQLEKNVRLNGVDALISCFNIAASSHEGSVEFGVHSACSGINAIINTSIHDRGLYQTTRNVKVNKLDNLFSNSGDTLALKIDVEGHEFDVLKGAERLLAENEVLIQIENRGGQTHVWHSFLKDIGYKRLCRIGEDSYYYNGRRLARDRGLSDVLEEAASFLVKNNLNAWPVRGTIYDCLSVDAKINGSTLSVSASVDETRFYGPAEFAFYLFKSKSRVGEKWYAQNGSADFELDADWDSLVLQVFAREVQDSLKVISKSMSIGRSATGLIDYGAPKIEVLFRDFTDAKQNKAVTTHEALESVVSDLREKFDRANSKYRGANEQIIALKAQLHSANQKYRASTESELLLKHDIEAQRRLLENNIRGKRELELRTRALAEQLNISNQKYRQVTQQLNVYSRSRVFKATRLLGAATRSWKDAIKLPVRFWRVIQRQSNVDRKTDKQSNLKPHHQVALVQKHFEFDIDRLKLSALLHKPIKQISVACIMDDFTYHSYQPECQLHPLTPTVWQGELEACQPELLFIESAWRGKDELWGSKVGHTSNELQGVVAWCRSQGIPTVFWNKEDPVHFETFLNTARLFDFVFTTDIDCIPRYKAALEHDRVFFLPFACQPTVHNPIEKYERKDAFCFAGAYYLRYPERTRDLEDFVNELPSFRPFAIYDRNYGKDNPEYQFPETYQPYVVGTLPYDQIDKAYKGYRYAINLNSIKQSQTMFARRVYELLGSNTLVVSNYSRGVRLMFGDLVITSDSGAEIKRRLEVLEKENRTDRLRLAGLRKVMLEHTYGDRIAYVLSKVTGREITQPLPSFKVLAAADTLEDLQRLVAHVQAQTGIDASLTLMLASGLSGAEVRAALPEPTFALELLHAEDVKGKKLAELADGACWVAGMVADDYYGPHYLLDIALATLYSDARAIGKGAWYAWQQGQCTLNDPDATYRPAPHLTARRSAITRALAEDIDATQWLTKLSEWTYEYSQQLAIDPYNYCADAIQGEPAQIREIVDDLPANHGISLQELIGIAETIPPMQHQEIDTPYFNGRELAHLLSGRPFVLHTNHEALSTEEQVDETIHLSRNQAIDAVLSGSTLQIRSELPDGKHEYLYSPVELDCNVLLARLPESTDRKIPIHFEMEPGLNLSLVVLYLDADKNRNGHVIEQPNRNHSIDLPEDAAYVRFGLRVYARGATRIKRLLLGHLDLEPQEILAQSDVLLLTNHYPSYDDLYRNGFVHSRVRAYREHGVHVNVFRLRENQPIAWHEFQDIDVTTGSQEALRRLLASGRYRHVLVHFLDPAMWEVLKDVIDTIPVTVWVHGAEIHPWYRRKFNIHTPEQEQAAREQSDQRMAFWRGLLRPMPANLKLVFVSETFSEEVMEDLGFRLPESQYAIIHNPIDTELFAYSPKSPEQRTKILSIRSYASKVYANDLSVEAIELLSIEPFFNELEFRLIGDGALFEETVAPVQDFSNVKIERRFLTRHEIAALHKEYGVFLCPSRMDTQGVSRDEAMSSGLVPITNAVAAIPEFVDDSSGVLAPAENAKALAHGIEVLYSFPDKFQSLSLNAAKRVREQSDKKLVIKQELYLFLPLLQRARTPAKLTQQFKSKITLSKQHSAHYD